MKTNPLNLTKSARDSIAVQRKKSTAIKVQFTLENPRAREVFLAGDFNHWNPAELPLRRETDTGSWSAEIALPPGAHEYRFVVDGEWATDPAADSVPNPFGSRNSIVHVALAQTRTGKSAKTPGVRASAARPDSTFFGRDGASARRK